MMHQKLVSCDPRFLKDPIVPKDQIFEDERGMILPLADEPMKSAVLITSKKGTVRANHYHHTDWHYCYLIKGAIDYYHRPVGDRRPPLLTQIKEGDTFFTPPMVEHAMVFSEDSAFVCLGRNSREQASYESDITRISLFPLDASIGA
jgi:quercetin dioxygenase-like cupin family protein